MNHPRVAYDVTQASADATGTGLYTARLRDSLTALLGDRLVPVSFGPLRTRRRIAFAARDIWWGPFGVLREARHARADLLHVPVPVGPLSGKLPLVVTIHDLAVLRFPEYFRPWFRTYARIVIPRLARRAAAVLTVSEASRREIIEHLRVRPDRVFVTPNGVDPTFSPLSPDDPGIADVRRRYRLPERFVLSVGTVEPRKNIARLIDAVAALQRVAGKVHLVHAGPDGWLSRDAYAAVERHGLQESVQFLGYVPPADLRTLYSLAHLLAYPSLYEGFGLPVLEAMACGCPVLTADGSSMPEVAGDAALQVDPLSVTAITDGLGRLWQDEALRSRLSTLGRARAQQFTWARTADLTIHAYQDVLGTA